MFPVLESNHGLEYNHFCEQLPCCHIHIQLYPNKQNTTGWDERPRTAPLSPFSSYLEEELVGARGHPVDCVVRAHNALGIPRPHRVLEGWKVGPCEVGLRKQIGVQCEDISVCLSVKMFICQCHI